MFDWEDQELANIIWGEAGENEDHIVPYPDETYEKPPGLYGKHIKESDKEAANVKLSEKATVSITDSLEGKVGSNTHYDTHGRVSTDGLGSLSDLSPLNATKSDLEHKEEKALVDKGSQTFDNQPEDRDANNFVDYGWANLESFDDLDRILSNNDLVYGNVNVSNAETLWSSPPDVIGCPEKSDFLSVDSPSLRLGALRSDDEHLETKSNFIKNENQTMDGHGKTKDHLHHSTLDVKTSLENLECGGGQNEHAQKEKSASEIVGRTPSLVYPIGAVNVAMPDEITIGKHAQMDKPRKSVRCQKKTGEARQPQTSCLPLDLSKKSTTESSPYKQCINPPPSPGYNIMGNQHPAVPAVPQFHSGEEHQQVPDAPMMPLSMTPQEKIEKLRRRQQMRALLAIRKQQQQFRHEVSCNDYSKVPRCSHESQMRFARAGNVEIDGSLSTLMSLDASSPLKQSDSATIPMTIDKRTLEDTILHQLENVIARLGIQIRLCIRDSLFRLAQSSLQRQYAGDKISINKSSRGEPNDVTEERLNSTKRMPNEETETNPIDRAVAHLLFHTPPELSEEFPQSRESPSCAKLSCETTATSTSFPTGFLNESYEDDKLSCLLGKDHELKSPCMDALENVSNKKTDDGSVVEIEASSRGVPLL